MGLHNVTTSYNGITHVSVLQGIYAFDYENLRWFMSQIRPDNGQRPGNQRYTDKVGSHTEVGYRVGKTATASNSSFY